MIDDPAAAEASLDPVRARLLAALTEPASAALLAAGAGLSRQQANYHLRALERHGLVEVGDAIAGLVAKYHDERAEEGREHRLVVALHPRITDPANKE